MLLLAAACSSGSPEVAPSPTPSALSPAPSATPTPTPAELLAVIGDYGIRGGQAPAMVRVLADYARTHAAGGRFTAVLTTGDNAYPRGARADARFARDLLDPLVRPGTRLVASLGNHDIGTDGGRPVMRAFGIPARWYATTVGQVQVIVLDANRPADPDQLAWLRRILLAPRTAPHRVAVFHQPAASCSAHTADPGVVRHLLPLLSAGRGRGVDLVLSGHYHTYERFLGPLDLPLVTTGGGGAQIYPSSRALCTGPARKQVLRSRFNAVVLSATTDDLVGVALSREGEVLDRFSAPMR